MDAIEMQITSVLDNVDPSIFSSPDMSKRCGTPDAYSPPTSPTTSNSCGTIRDKKRTITRESTQSRYTADSLPMSVIGVLNGSSTRRGHGSILDSDQISSADRLLASSKHESISSRVAMIQAKVG